MPEPDIDQQIADVIGDATKAITSLLATAGMVAGDKLQDTVDELNLGVALFRHSPDALLVVRGDGTVMIINAEAERLTGYGREIRGTNIGLLVPAALRARHEKLRAQYTAAPVVREMGAGQRDSLRLLRKDGTEIPVWIKLAPAESLSGKAYIIAAVRPKLGP